MTQCIPCYLLIPKAKLAQSPIAFTRFLKQILIEFGGYTFERETRGSWLDRTGVIHDDFSLPLLVSVPDHRASLDALKTMVASLAHDLGEHCIFTMIGQRETIFIWARKAPRVHEWFSLAATKRFSCGRQRTKAAHAQHARTVS